MTPLLFFSVRVRRSATFLIALVRFHVKAYFNGPTWKRAEKYSSPWHWIELEFVDARIFVFNKPAGLILYSNVYHVARLDLVARLPTFFCIFRCQCFRFHAWPTFSWPWRWRVKLLCWITQLMCWSVRIGHSADKLPNTTTVSQRVNIQRLAKTNYGDMADRLNNWFDGGCKFK